MQARPLPNEWNEVARAKLVAIFGAAKGETMFRDTLRSIGLQRLTTADELHAFGTALGQGDGFSAAAGGLLKLHALMHGSRGPEHVNG